METRHRRKFTDEFKAETVKLVRESGRTVGWVSRELDLTETVRNWVKQAEASGSADTLSPDERAERRLREENWELRLGEGDPPKNDGLLRQGKSMRLAFIDVEKASYLRRRVRAQARLSSKNECGILPLTADR
jgi:transposase